jgi:hypothetical protein
VWVRQAIEDGKSIFEERTGCALADYRHVLDHGTPVQKAVFMAQMMQTPTPVNEQLDRAAIQYHSDSDDEIRAGYVFMNLDTAASSKEKADFHGFVVWLCTWGQDEKGNWRKEFHALEAFQKRVDQFGFWDEVYRLFFKYSDVSPVMGITLQKEVIENVYMSSYEKARLEHGVPLPLIEARIHKADKQKRISRLLPWFKDGSAKLRRGQVEFEDQLVYGDKAPNDDIADPASDVVEVAKWPECPVAEKKAISRAPMPTSEREAWNLLSKQMAEAEREEEEREALALAEMED